ncbi:glycosyltransferase family 8 protein [Aspergillus stella-maris]|uniref:glycosyltransferase family 8 protein n=1 Tax=Aspergillus stella-maris TaxID=1810926 RepID=UPI003CCC96C8
MSDTTDTTDTDVEAVSILTPDTEADFDFDFDVETILEPEMGLGKKAWTTLITNKSYLPGLLTLSHSLKAVKSVYPLLVLYTDSFPPEGRAMLNLRCIPTKRVPYLLPSISKDFSKDVRFHDCWSKLVPFGLTEFERVVQLDCDMLVVKNMDELMDLELDGPEMAGSGSRVFGAAHACVCNPQGKRHYPKNWQVMIPANCAYTTQHTQSAATASTTAASANAGLGIPNGGLLVINPSQAIYDKILSQLSSSATADYAFADQSLLGDMFGNRWVSLPYTYNALKTMRLSDVHAQIWRDENVKNVHYILSPKPWEEGMDRDEGRDWDPLSNWWWEANEERERFEFEDKIGDELLMTAVENLAFGDS